MTLDRPIHWPPVRPGEAVVISASTFQTFSRCPEQAAGRLRGIYPRETRPSFVGGLAHRVFARHLKRGPIPADEFAGACREEIGGSMNVKLNALGIKPSELDRVVEEVGRLYDRFRLLGLEGFRGAEVGLEVEPAEGVVLRGSIDAVFDDSDVGTRLVDWKTGSLGDPADQLGFYALLWALDRVELPGRIEAVSVSTGERYEDAPSSSSVEEMAARVASAVDELRHAFEMGGSLDRIAGPWCRWCPLLDGCSEGSAATALLDG